MFFVAIIFLALAIGYWKYSRIVESLADFPGPRPLPFVGNAYMLVGLTVNDILPFAISSINKFGSLFKFFLGPIRLLVLSDPKYVETLLVDKKLLEKSVEYEISRVWIGNGVLTASQDEWPARRKVTNPGFHFRNLQEFVKVFEKNSQVLVERLRENEGETFDILPYIKLCALDNLCGEIIFNQRFS
jgi:cytochrome P450 family 4